MGALGEKWLRRTGMLYVIFAGISIALAFTAFPTTGDALVPLFLFAIYRGIVGVMGVKYSADEGKANVLRVLGVIALVPVVINAMRVLLAGLSFWFTLLLLLGLLTVPVLFLVGVQKNKPQPFTGSEILKSTGIVYLVFAGMTALVGILGLIGSDFLASMRPEGFIFARALRTYVMPAGAMPVFHVILLFFAAYRLFIGMKTYANHDNMEKAGFLGLLGKIDLSIVILLTGFSTFFIAGFSFIWFALSSFAGSIMLLSGSAKNDFRPGRAARSEARAAKLFLIPAFLGLTLITYIPLASVFVLSLFDWRIPGTPTFAGFANYIHLFTENFFFWTSIRVTIVYAFLTVIIGMVYSMVIALLLNRKMPGRTVFRTIFYLPFIIPVVASFMIWRLLYSWQGPINSIANMLGGDRIHFLADNATIIPALAIVAVWASGNIIVIKMAGLGNVPRVYQEAAEIDGANAWHRFWKITIPCMTPIIFYNMLMSLVTHMQVFVPSLMMAAGGSAGRGIVPESYLFMTFTMYREGFMNGIMGRANALSFIFFILVGIFTAILFATSKSWLFYEGGAPK